MVNPQILTIAKAIAASDMRLRPLSQCEWEALSTAAREQYLRNAHAVEAALPHPRDYPVPPAHWRITMYVSDGSWMVDVEQGDDGYAAIDANDDPIRALIEHIAEETTDALSANGGDDGE